MSSHLQEQLLLLTFTLASSILHFRPLRRQKLFSSHRRVRGWEHEENEVERVEQEEDEEKEEEGKEEQEEEKVEQEEDDEEEKEEEEEEQRRGRKWRRRRSTRSMRRRTAPHCASHRWAGESHRCSAQTAPPKRSPGRLTSYQRMWRPPRTRRLRERRLVCVRPSSPMFPVSHFFFFFSFSLLMFR